MQRKSGLYEIKSKISEHRYIGSAVDLDGRWAVHKYALRRGQHYSIPLQRSWNKYGEKSIKFSTLFYCDPELLVPFEQRALDVIRPEYNVSPTAGSRLGDKHSPEIRSEMSRQRQGHGTFRGRRHTEETKEKIRQGKLGKKLSPEHRASISASLVGNKYRLGVKHDERSRAAMRAAWARRKSGD